MSELLIPIRQYAYTAAQLATENTILLDKQLAIERDTGKMKLGNGTTAYNSLAYILFNGNSSQYVRGDGTLQTFPSIPSITGLVPYTGANANVNLGVFSITANSIVKNGGLSSQFLKADGSSDSNAYLTSISGLTAGGELDGTYPNPTILNSAVLAKVLTGLNLTGGGTIVATDSMLQAFGKVQNQLSALLGGVMYQGVWNASTNTPSLTSSIGTKGNYYIVTVAGSTNLKGITDWKVGDWAIFNGTSWDKVDNTDAVSSVNGFTGAVNLTTANVSEVTNLYFTNARVIASTLTGYTSGSGTISSSDTVLTAIQKLNGNMVTSSSGTTNRISKFTASGVIGDSLILDNGTQIITNNAANSGEHFIIGGSAGVNGRTRSTNGFWASNVGSGYALNDNGTGMFSTNQNTIRFRTYGASGTFGLYDFTSEYSGLSVSTDLKIISISATLGTDTAVVQNRTALWINPTVNYTGGGTGISRGVYINPTLTSAPDWRSIEWSNNSGFGLYGIGTAPNIINGSLTLGNLAGTGTRIVTADASGVLSTVTNGVIPATQIRTTKQTLTPTGTTQSIDWNNGSIVDLVLSSATGNVTLTLLNSQNASSYLIEVTNGATPRNLIFPTGTKQAGGGGNVYVGTANQKDVIAVLWDGTQFLISASRNYF